MKAALFFASAACWFGAASTLFAQASKGGHGPPTGVAIERDVEYGRVGARALKLDLVRPKNPASKTLPIVVWIHGGGWQSGSKDDVRVLIPFVATGEYVGASIGYRLSGEAQWPAQIDDCKAAVRWIRSHADKLGVDPERIGVAGASAGGHLVAMLGTNSESTGDGKTLAAPVSCKVACVVDYFGPTELLALTSRDRPSGAIDGLLGGRAYERQELAREASPLLHVGRNSAPFLIIHGDKDPIVPFNESEKIHKALKQAGVSSVLIKVEGGGHGPGCFQPEILKRVHQFLDNHLRGKHEEISEAPVQFAPPPKVTSAGNAPKRN